MDKASTSGVYYSYKFSHDTKYHQTHRHDMGLGKYNILKITFQISS